MFSAIARNTQFASRFSLHLTSKPQIVRVARFHITPITMVEGHQCHRIANAHRKSLVGKKFKASSPNGRFTDGANAIDNKPLYKIEVHGKNLFYFFGNDDNPSTTNPVILHFHFGMSGTFLTASLPGPEPKPTCRLQLISIPSSPVNGVNAEKKESQIIGQLSAMTVQHGDLAFYLQKKASLGQDPLRDDADPELVWDVIKRSKKPIGLLLMDQSVIAGIGNIYRAEILFKSGIHPEIPGNTISRTTFNTIWSHSVDLLYRGYQSGSILTVDDDEAKILGPPWTRRYVYNHSHCGRCGGSISTWDMASRTVYACTTCQPLAISDNSSVDGGGDGSGSKKVEISAQRKAAMKKKVNAVPFVSHCAPDHDKDSVTAGVAGLKKLTVAALKERLIQMGLPTGGKKADLVDRLLTATITASADDGKKEKKGKEEAVDDAQLAVPTPATIKSKKKANRSSSTDGDKAAVYPEVYDWHIEEGSSSKEDMASAKEAALEKLRAGEGRNVEHVAMQDDDTLAINELSNKRLRAK